MALCKVGVNDFMATVRLGELSCLNLRNVVYGRPKICHFIFKNCKAKKHESVYEKPEMEIRGCSNFLSPRNSENQRLYQIAWQLCYEYFSSENIANWVPKLSCVKRNKKCHHLICSSKFSGREICAANFLPLCKKSATQFWSKFRTQGDPQKVYLLQLYTSVGKLIADYLITEAQLFKCSQIADKIAY